MKNSTQIYTAEPELATDYWRHWQSTGSEISRHIIINAVSQEAISYARLMGADEDQQQNAVEVAIRMLSDGSFDQSNIDGWPRAVRTATRYSVLQARSAKEPEVCIPYESDEDSRDPWTDTYYAELKAAVDKLPTDEAFIVSNYYGLGTNRQLSLQEIADHLSVARSTVHRKLNDALKTLGSRFSA
jgi:RNA polymerase sigma factor (sigma-70 family)